MLDLPPLPSDFTPLDPEKPIEVYQRLLPHWRQDGATYAVTFRLADSLPKAKLDCLVRVARSNSRLPKAKQDERLRKSIEAYLDGGHGRCWLRRRDLTAEVLTSLRKFDGVRYHLFAAVVMPNHVHAVVRPVSESLEKSLNGIKAGSASRVLPSIDAKKPFWQRESYDRLVRDGEHLWRCVQYLGWNVRGFSDAERKWRTYVRPDWEAAGWGVRLDALPPPRR